MIIIIDSNVTIAALIKDSITRKIIVDLYPHAYYPEAMASEIEKYKGTIREKANITEHEFYGAYQKLFKYIKIIPDEEIIKHKNEAKRMMKDIDSADHLLLAAAFYFKDVCIWSNDPHLKQQNKIVTYTTAEMIKKIKGFLSK
ncbi:PIN domain-containing protein [Candidatus Micrarchaeota archaeon]|nr:PIN domain-containing protein [Candidatus Micrarchaeota archaeon]